MTVSPMARSTSVESGESTMLSTHRASSTVQPPPQQCDVARLCGRGMSNPDIAQRVRWRAVPVVR